MNKAIIQFIKEQTCAGICCVDETGKPYCFSCFYAFNAEKGLLYFKSSRESHHAVLLMKNPLVAGTILPDKTSTLKVKGLQLEGMVLHLLYFLIPIVTLLFYQDQEPFHHVVVPQN